MFTKGDWSWKQNRGNNYYEHSVFASNDYRGEALAELSGKGCTKEEVKANACLMAAAPALLDVCEKTAFKLETMTTEEYQQGGDKSIRILLKQVITQARKIK